MLRLPAHPAVRRGLVRRPAPLRRRTRPAPGPPSTLASASPRLFSTTATPSRAPPAPSTCARCRPAAMVRPAAMASLVRHVTPRAYSTATATATSTSTTSTSSDTVSPAAAATLATPAPAQPDLDGDEIGPLQEYDRRVAAGRLRNDDFQRSIIKRLQPLHDALRTYHAPPVVRPDVDALRPRRTSLLGALFGGAKAADRAWAAIPDDLPKGLYLYGDVGSGKTMLMDLFYDTLPSAVRSKTRIHFHNFMQDVHRRLHRYKMQHGVDVDAVPLVAADMAEQGNVLCFDEFQCTDVADAMILRRLLESLMGAGVVLVTTSNRHPDDLYKNGIQRESFVPAIELLKDRLDVVALDSPTDYRKIPRPPSGVYHTRLDDDAAAHADKWFRFLGDPEDPAGHPETRTVWGRPIRVPRASGRCARFTFDELIGTPMSAADYIELTRAYDAFVLTDVPGMTHAQRDLARRLITFIDAVYEAQAKLVLTTAKPLAELFVSRDEIAESLASHAGNTGNTGNAGNVDVDVDDVLKKGHAMMTDLKDSGLFAGTEEAFAFSRALSRLTQMGSREWVERGLDQHKQAPATGP